MSLYDQLRITAVPLDIAIGDKSQNRSNLEKSIELLPTDTDVAVLPELWSTGYIASPEDASVMAESNSGESMSLVASLSRKKNVAIAGSFLACDDNGKLFNRAFFVEPSGECTFYDKRHLFILSQEASVVEQGKRLSPIIRFRGWNIALSVCYDIRFPIWNRNTALKYDLLIVPANWPSKRGYAWEHLLQARAIENLAYVIGANRSGSDPYGEYDDVTYIFDYMGKPIGESANGLVTATLSKDRLQKFRTSFPVWKDADDATIKL